MTSQDPIKKIHIVITEEEDEAIHRQYIKRIRDTPPEAWPLIAKCERRSLQALVDYYEKLKKHHDRSH